MLWCTVDQPKQRMLLGSAGGPISGLFSYHAEEPIPNRWCD